MTIDLEAIRAFRSTDLRALQHIATLIAEVERLQRLLMIDATHGNSGEAMAETIQRLETALERKDEALKQVEAMAQRAVSGSNPRTKERQLAGAVLDVAQNALSRDGAGEGRSNG